MEMKIIYIADSNLRIEAIAANEEERKNLVKMIKYTILDLKQDKVNESLKHIDSKDAEETTESQTELASDPQKVYMAKLGIPFTDKTTKIEAIDLINSWKEAHNIPITAKKRP